MSPRLLAGRLAATRSSVLLLGPRQVGKSTICRGLGARLYVDLADESVFLGYAKDPARLRREVDALPGGSLVVIDEVQRVPALLNTVQSLVDRSARRIRFVLTGSSARKLRRGGANLLPGRVILEYLDPPSGLAMEDVAWDRALRLIQRERVLLFDVGVRNALLGLHRHPLGPDRVGGVFEQWVMLQVIYLNHALRKGWKLSSYRTEAGAEVDLIVERARDIVAIEIKAGKQVTAADTRGLLSLAGLMGQRRPLAMWVAFRGERAQRFGSGVEALPVLEALRRLAAD